MKKNLTIYTLLIIAAFGISISVKSQERKKPSERQFSQEISKIKQMRAERNKLIEQTKAQTAESTTTGTAAVPANTQIQNPPKTQSSQTIKPSSGSMRKPQRPVASKG